jgi:transcriptional regulator with XRE-family HTH domain
MCFKPTGISAGPAPDFVFDELRTFRDRFSFAENFITAGISLIFRRRLSVEDAPLLRAISLLSILLPRISGGASGDSQQMNGSINLADLGRRARAMRLARRLTLEEVVTRASFTVSWLSKLENGQLTPSLEGLVKLAGVLECGVEDLVEGLSTPPRHVVVKAGHGRVKTGRNGKSAAVIEHLADTWRGRTMRPTIVHLPMSERTPTPKSLNGQQFLFVLEGDVRFDYADDVILLAPGDSVYFDATIPHRLVSRGKSKARVLTVALEPNGDGGQNGMTTRRMTARGKRSG